MRNLPPPMIYVLRHFERLFSERVWEWATMLLVGARMAPGKRTVTAVLRMMGLSQERQFQNFHRVLNRARWSPRAVNRVLLRLLMIWLVVALAFGPVVGLRGALVLGLVFGLIGGLGVSLAGTSTNIEPVTGLHSSWPAFRAELPRALVFGLGGGLIYGLSSGLIFGILIGLGSGLVIGLGSALGNMFAKGVIQERMQPNQGIYHSGRSGLVLGLVIGPLIGLVFGFAFSLIIGLDFALAFGLASALILGLVCGLRGGGSAYLQHYLLRLLLIRTGSIPRRLDPFLEYATQRIFLRRVGGGYIFIHRLLLEHFAAQYIPPDTPASTAAGHTRRVP